MATAGLYTQAYIHIPYTCKHTYAHHTQKINNHNKISRGWSTQQDQPSPPLSLPLLRTKLNVNNHKPSPNPSQNARTSLGWALMWSLRFHSSTEKNKRRHFLWDFHSDIDSGSIATPPCCLSAVTLKIQTGSNNQPDCSPIDSLNPTWMHPTTGSSLLHGWSGPLLDSLPTGKPSTCQTAICSPSLWSQL